MSTINRTALEIHVVHVDRHPIEDVTVHSPALSAKALGGGRFVFQSLPRGRIQVRVESPGLAPAELSITR